MPETKLLNYSQKKKAKPATPYIPMIRSKTDPLNPIKKHTHPYSQNQSPAPTQHLKILKKAPSKNEATAPTQPS